MKLKKLHSLSLPTILMIVIACALLAYTVTRAVLLSLTPDEVSTLQTFGAKFIIYPESYNVMSANHHWLNSWLMFFSRSVFGDNEFAFRLPNLLAHAAYLLFTARLMLLLRKDIFAVAGFILLNVHPYLLDFFSLARGYGLAFGAFAAAIFFLYRFISERSNKQLVFTLISLSLAVLANFTFLNIYLIAGGILILFCIREMRLEKRKIFRQLAIIILFTAGLFAFILPHLFNLKNANALFAGSTEFWEGTVRTICDGLLYDMPYKGENVLRSCLPSIIISLVILITCNILVVIRKQWREPAMILTLSLGIIFFGSLLIMFMQHVILNVPYPSQRYGLYLFVLFIFAFVAALSTLRISKIITTSFAFLLILPVCFHMFSCANVNYVLEWRGSGNVNEMMKRIIEDRKNSADPERYVTMCSDGEASTTISGLQGTWNLYWVINTGWWTYEPMEEADYHIVSKRFAPYRNTSGWKMLDTFPVSGNALYIDTASFFYKNKKGRP